MHQVIAQAHFHNILSSFHIPKPSKAQRESPKYDIFPSFKKKKKKPRERKIESQLDGTVSNKIQALNRRNCKHDSSKNTSNSSTLETSILSPFANWGRFFSLTASHGIIDVNPLTITCRPIQWKNSPPIENSTFVLKWTSFVYEHKIRWETVQGEERE